MKKYSAIFFSCLLSAALFFTPAHALIDASEDFYVNDGAAVLLSDTKNQIIEANGNLEHYCSGAQIVVVTVDYLEQGYDSEQYANLLFNEWGVGSATNNNGMLLLLVTEEYRGWLTVGEGISGALSDDEINSMLDEYFWGYVDNNEYDTAVSSIFVQVLSWYEGYYGVSLGGSGNSGELIPNSGSSTQDYYQDQYGYDNYYGSGFSIFGSILSSFLIFIVIALFIILSIFNSAGRRRYYRSYGVWPMFWFFGPRGPMRGPRNPFDPNNPGKHPPGGFNDSFHGGGFGGGGRSGGFGGGFGGGGFGGGGHSSGGGGGRR